MTTAADDRLVIDYYFSVLSDWAYMGGERFECLVRRFDAHVNYKPIKLAVLYANTGGIILQKRSKQRQDYRVVELERWRDKLGMPITLHPRFYPADDTLAAGMIISAADSGLDAGRFVNLIHRAIWVEEQDIANVETLKRIAGVLHSDPEKLLESARSPAVIEKLNRNTEEAASRGVFGSPFYFYGHEAFWGQDRLDFLEDVLVQARNGKSSKNRPQ